MSDTKVQTAEDLLSAFHQLPEFEQVLMMQRLSFSNSFQLDGEKLVENYKGRVIEISRCQEGWHAFYGYPNGEKISKGFIYETAGECLLTTRAVIAWEIEQAEITDQFKQLIDQFKAKGYTQAGIMSGLSEALADTLDESDWRNEVIQVLEEATKSAKLPGRILP